MMSSSLIVKHSQDIQNVYEEVDAAKLALLCEQHAWIVQPIYQASEAVFGNAIFRLDQQPAFAPSLQTGCDPPVLPLRNLSEGHGDHAWSNADVGKPYDAVLC